MKYFVLSVARAMMTSFFLNSLQPPLVTSAQIATYLDIILTPNGVITLTNYFDENNYFEFYDSNKTLVNINEGLWVQPDTYKLPKPKKPFRRRRIARHRSK